MAEQSNKDFYISVLELVTGYSYEYLKTLTEHQLELLYKERAL